MEIEFIICEVQFSHVRRIGGQNMLLDNIFSGPTALPNDEDTKKAIAKGWLTTVSEPFMAEPAFDPNAK